MKKIICCCITIFFLSVIGCRQSGESDTEWNSNGATASNSNIWSCRITSSSNQSEVGLCWEETWSNPLMVNDWCEAKVKSSIGFWSTNVTYRMANESCP